MAKTVYGVWLAGNGGWVADGSERVLICDCLAAAAAHAHNMTRRGKGCEFVPAMIGSLGQPILAYEVIRPEEIAEQPWPIGTRVRGGSDAQR